MRSGRKIYWVSSSTKHGSSQTGSHAGKAGFTLIELLLKDNMGRQVQENPLHLTPYEYI